ncbi:MAG: pilus assembly protein, partial [Chloroflexaceae bacterium]|nr:pilus assembly protein [Chloroflexaceae bacterium]
MLRTIRQRCTTAGQAIVEFALSATLIFFLLAAAVDLGLIFFTLQALNNAAQEGAIYGARHVLVASDGMRTIDENEILNRVRFEAGETTNVTFVDLFDLNNNDVSDITGNEIITSANYNLLTFEGGVADPVVRRFIRWEILTQEDRQGGDDTLVNEADSDFLDDNDTTDCLNQRVTATTALSIQQSCYVRVT